MDKDAFYQKISDAISMGDPVPVEANTNFESLGDAWDSMARVMVLSMISDEYEISISGEELTSCQTAGELAAMLEQKGL